MEADYLVKILSLLPKSSVSSRMLIFYMEVSVTKIRKNRVVEKTKREREPPRRRREYTEMHQRENNAKKERIRQRKEAIAWGRSRDKRLWKMRPPSRSPMGSRLSKARDAETVARKDREGGHGRRLFKNKTKSNVARLKRGPAAQIANSFP